MSTADRDGDCDRRVQITGEYTPLVKSGPTETERRQDRYWTPERQRFMMYLYFAGSIVVYSSRTAMALCMPHMFDEFGWNKKQQGLVLACFLWGYPVTQVLGGYLADRFGAERVILFAGSCWSTVTFLTPLFPSLGSGSAQSSLSLVMFSRISQGILQGMHYPSVMSATSQHVADQERTYVYSVISSGTHGGTLFIGFVGSIILNYTDWASVFHFLGLMGVVWIFVLYTYGDTRNDADITVRDKVDSEHKPESSPNNKIPWGKVLRAPAFWAMLMGAIANGYSGFVFLFWLPSFFHEKFPKAQPWVYNVLPWFICMTSAILFGMLADSMLKRKYSKTFTRKCINVVAMFVFGVCLICVSYVHTYPSTLLLFCMATAGSGAYQSTIIMSPSDILPEHTGFIFGIMNMCCAAFGFIGTYASGAILEATGNWGLMYAVTGWVSIAGWAVFAYWGSADPIL